MSWSVGLAYIGKRPTREDGAILPGTEARPADILLPAWSSHKDTALDIMVVSTLQSISRNPWICSQKDLGEKKVKHGDPCKELGIVF